jgi:hypothetical protein
MRHRRQNRTWKNCIAPFPHFLGLNKTLTSYMHHRRLHNPLKNYTGPCHHCLDQSKTLTNCMRHRRQNRTWKNCIAPFHRFALNMSNMSYMLHCQDLWC